MTRSVIQIEGLHVSQRSSCGKPRDIGNRGVSTNIESSPVRCQTARASLIGFHFQRSGADQAPFTEDQLGTLFSELTA